MSRVDVPDPRPGEWITLNTKAAAVWGMEELGIRLDAFNEDNLSAEIPEDATWEDLAKIKKALRFGRILLTRNKKPKVKLDVSQNQKNLMDALDNTIPEIKDMVEDGKFSPTQLEILLNMELKREKTRKVLVSFLRSKVKKNSSELVIGVEGGGPEGLVYQWERKPIKKGSRTLRGEPDDTPIEEEIKKERRINRG